MGLLFRSLVMLLLLLLLPCLPPIQAQLSPGSSNGSARALDVLLQDYAYRAFVRPRTGIPYDGKVPSNLTGIKISAMRLRSGSLRSKGVPMYKEFEIPVGVVEKPYVERLVLVYQNLGNWSSVYYPLSGYTYIAPVLGLLAYDASNLSATNLPVLNVTASMKPISINFSSVKSVPRGFVPKCVWFDLQGSVNISNTVSSHMCSTIQQGHFALVVKGTIPSPPPMSAPAPAPAPAPSPLAHKKKTNTKKIWIIVGSVVGGLLLLTLAAILLVLLRKYKQRRRMEQMERAADTGEALRMARVGSTIAPAAMGTRTQPTLETEYAP